MTKYQDCRGCGKFRMLDDHHSWSHWQDPRGLAPVQIDIAQKVSCQQCDYQLAKRRLKPPEGR